MNYHAALQIEDFLPTIKYMAPSQRRITSTHSGLILGIVALLSTTCVRADTSVPWNCSIAADGTGWHCSANDSSDGPMRPLPVSLRRQTLPPGADRGSAFRPPEIPENLDWVTLESSTSPLLEFDSKALLSARCGGAYVDPLANSDQSKNLDEFAIEASAARSEIENGVARFEGGVIIRQGYRQLSSDLAVVDRNRNRAKLESNVILREPGMLLVSNVARIDTESGQSSLENARFVFHESHMRGGADSIVRQDNGSMVLDQASLTYCPPDNENWLLAAESIDLDADTGLGTAHGATLQVAGVPILYAPWLSFPMDDRRATGFLWPTIGSDSDGGLDVAVPYYINLAPNYDLTLTPRVIMDRGVSGEVEFRHLSEAAGMWTVGGAFMPEDDVYLSDFPEEDGARWLSHVSQDGLFADRWRTNINYSRASDDRFFRDLDTTSLDAQRSTHLVQSGEVDYLGNGFTAGVLAQQFQTIDSRSLFTRRHNYKVLPKVFFEKRRKLEPFSPDIILNAEYVNFDHEILVTGRRLYAEAGVSYPMTWPAGFITPTVKYRHVDYDLSDLLDPTSQETPSASSGLFSLDAGVFLEREFSRSGKQFVQTLEPRVFYLYSEEDVQTDQPIFDTIEPVFSYARLFRDSRFTGHDRLDDANQVSLGLTTRFIEADSGEELFSASLGQIFYFEDREVFLRQPDPDLTLSTSEIAAEFRYRPAETLQLNSAVLWDSRRGKVNDFNFALNYSPADAGVYNLGYSYRRPGTTTLPLLDPEQLDLSAFWPMSEKWRLFARLRYSIDRSDRIEDSFGVEYNSCCWRIRVMHSRSVDRDDTLSFIDTDPEFDNATWIEFQLKGLGSIGNRVGRALEEMVWGYSENDY